jgi:hypothetical protein
MYRIYIPKYIPDAKHDNLSVGLECACYLHTWKINQILLLSTAEQAGHPASGHEVYRPLAGDSPR